MTVIIQDSFNRTGANLGSNPSGRWNIPVGDFTVNGQVAATDSTVTASTSPWAHFYAPSVGTKYGESRIQAIRGTTQVKAIGVVARASTITSDRARYWFGWTNESGTEKFELRLYSTNTAYTVVGTVNASTLSITGDLAWHTYAIRIIASGSLINITCKYDTTTCLVLNNQSDPLGVVVPASYQPGFQLTTSSTWTSGTDYAQFDLSQFDDLATPSIESAPTLTSEPALTPISVTAEVDSLFTGATFPPPDFGEQITERFWVNRARSEAGYETTFAKYTTGRKMWRVQWTTISPSDLGILQTYNRSVATSTAQAVFNYAAPDGITYTTSFVEGTLSFEQLAPNVYNASAVFEELF